MDIRYTQGIEREVCIRRGRGESISSISRSLRVTEEFIHKAMSVKQRLVIEREPNVSYEGLSKVGGY